MHRHLKKYGAVLLALILIVSSVMPVLAEVDGIGPDDDYLLEGVYGEDEFLLDDDEASPGDALPSDTELEEVEYLNEDGVLETRECYVIKRSLNGLTLKEGEWYAIKKSYSISGRIIHRARKR